MEDEKKSSESTSPTKKFSDKYEVLYLVGTVPIRRNNLLSIYMPEHSMAKVARIVSDTGLSAAKVLAISGTPCECCKGKPVIISIDGEPYEIPRGLFTSKRTNSGVKIQDKKRSGK